MKIKEGDYVILKYKNTKDYKKGMVSEIHKNIDGNNEVDVLTINLDVPLKTINGIPDWENQMAYRYECKLDVQRNREERLKKLLDNE
ncbi:MAG: hypothetical protein SLAVMIC_00967 [uncultured marine phage]|uniref:Uncharacterized protein n=1 Tax=uncultured marine phage TaxID=707152 RepID=A0A8D9FQN8_9VIRU|nr:MAG: hypothetical protein SLAVMIC_00967 [uncultured marine phage]